MKTKVNLGVGPRPFHPQHLQVMTNLDEWILVDKYIEEPGIENWDATNLEKIGDLTMEVIYASHLLEHIPHPQVPSVLYHWFRKLKVGGKLILNVPDLKWAARQIIKYENGTVLDSNVFNAFNGDNSLQDIVYGTHEHEGERHQSAYTKRSLTELLTEAGYVDIEVEEAYDAHDMGVLLATAWKRTKQKSM
jgi:predicted SAM-dependent methyltransferase